MEEEREEGGRGLSESFSERVREGRERREEASE